MSESKIQFSKDNIDGYLKALGKEYRKRAGKGIKGELILVGGAAILVNYGFRDITTAVDALIQAASSMKDAINHVGDTFGLPNGWLNEDFAQTVSFSPKLVEYSTHYRTYANVLEVRTIAAEYLIAMKSALDGSTRTIFRMCWVFLRNMRNETSLYQWSRSKMPLFISTAPGMRFRQHLSNLSKMQCVTDNLKNNMPRLQPMSKHRLRSLYVLMRLIQAE